LSEAGADFHADGFGVSGPVADAVGTKAAPGSLAIRRFSLARRTGGSVERLYPVPRDVLAEKDTAGEALEDRTYTALRPASEVPAAANFPPGSRPLWPAGRERGDVYTGVEAYVPEPAFRRLLRGDDLSDAMSQAVEPEDLFRAEPRTSVSLNTATGTAKEGRLFTVQFTRAADEVGFAVGLAGTQDAFGQRGRLRLGGEARAARYQRADLSQRGGGQALADRVAEEDGRLKATLITPAVFDGGWRPDGIEPGGGGEVAGCPVRLTGAATGKPRHLGGWDIAEGRPKPARHAVPPGSVYFFKLADSEAASALAEHGPVVSLCNSGDDRKQGLGLAYLSSY
jgi:CRISPR-associated protein Cmr3